MERLYSLGIPHRLPRQDLPDPLARRPHGRSAGVFHLWPTEQPFRSTARMGAGRRRNAPGMGHQGGYGQHAGRDVVVA